jgi:hypothetical protein
MRAAARPNNFALGLQSLTVPGRSALGIMFVLALTWATMLAMFFLSHLMLEELGIPYESPGGSSLTKIHPATYLSLLAGVAFFILRGPVPFTNEIIQRHKGWVVLGITWLMLFVYIVVFQGKPLTSTIDTFLLPMMLFLILPRLQDNWLRQMALFVHLAMAANALMGIAEFVGGFRLSPIMAEGIELTSDWRSSAFLGHPLTNALVTGTYAVALMLGGGRDLPSWARIPALGLQAFAMLAFGGRMAMALMAVYGAAWAGWHALNVLNGRRMSVNAAAAFVFVVPLVVIGFGLLIGDGFFDKFLMRFVEDEGSAASRLRMFDLLSQLSWEELFTGPDPIYVMQLQRLNGIAFGIESFWVGFVAYYGLLITIPFLIGMIAFWIDLGRSATWQGWWTILFFVAVCTTSASLSGKTTVIGILVVINLTMFRRSLAVRRR